MNTEKLEKLKKSLDNKFIPDNVKDKIRNEIKNLESEIKSEDITATELKKEVSKVEEKVEVAVEKAEKKAESTEPKKGRGRPRKTPANTPAEPKATETAIKKTAMSVAKTIRKDGEKWNDAMKRANGVMKKEKVEVKKTTKSELDRLLARVIKNKSLMSELKGVKDLGRDAVRTAKPVGKRMSESGNVYYEYRANKTDRKTYGKYAFAGGGNLEQPYNVIYTTTSGRTMVAKNIMAINEDLAKQKLKKQMRASTTFDKILMAHESFATGGITSERRYVNHSEDYEVRYAKNKPKRKGYSDKRSFDDGGNVDKPKELKGYFVHVLKSPYDSKMNIMPTNEKIILVTDGKKGDSFSVMSDEPYLQLVKRNLFGKEYIHAEPVNFKNTKFKQKMFGGNFVWSSDSRFRDDVSELPVPLHDRIEHYELGGSVVTDLAGHTGGSFATGNEGILDGLSNTAYTGLVGETGAMSSGEMFMNGGGLPDGAEQSYINYYLGEGASSSIYKDGGVIMNQYEGKNAEEVWNIWNLDQREHFLADHYDVLMGKDLGSKRKNFKDLADITQIQLELHVSQGQYAKGGATENYVSRKNLNTITIKKGNQKLTYKISDVLNGAYKLESGAKLEDIAFYVPKRSIVKVQLKTGSDFKPANGYWIKDGAKPIHVTKFDEGGSIEKSILKITPFTTKRDSKGFRFYSDNTGNKLFAEKDNKIYNVNDDLKVIGEVPLQRVRFVIEGIISDEDVKNLEPLHYEAKTIKRVREQFGLKNKYNEGGVMSRLLTRKKDQPKVETTDEDIDLNEDSRIRVRPSSFVRKDKEGDWMMKKNSSKEARSYAGGGEIRVGDKVKVKASGIGEDYAIVTGIDSLNDVLKRNDDPNTYLSIKDSKGYNWEIYLKEVVEFPSKTKLFGGGKVTFSEKAKAIAKNFEGKRVEPKYQKEYGKVYDKIEAKEVGNKIAGSQKASYDAKLEKGSEVKKKAGNPKMKATLDLAKKIRKDGEKWTDAVKRASLQLK